MIEIENAAFIKRRYKPLCVSKFGLIAYHKNRINILQNGKFRPICTLEQSFLTKLKGMTRLGERIFRTEPQAAIMFDGLLYVAMRHQICAIDIAERQIVSTFAYRKEYIHADRLVCIENIKGFDDCVAYGEYFANEKRESVAIFTKGRINNDFIKVFEFPSATVRHIHNIIPSKENDCVLILTGDEDDESGIWLAKNNFETVEPLLIGNQEYRSCIGFFDDKDTFVFSTDIPSRANSIYQLDIHSKTITRIEKLCGSCTTGCKVGDKYLFCSSVESQEPTERSKQALFNYLFSKKLPAGIKDKYSRLYYGNITNGFFVKCKMEKDFFPAGLARFGKAQCVYDPYNDLIYFYPIAVKKYDGKLYCFSTVNLDMN